MYNGALENQKEISSGHELPVVATAQRYVWKIVRNVREYLLNIFLLILGQKQKTKNKNC